MSGEELRVRVARCLQTTFDREHDGENGEWAKMADAVLALLAAERLPAQNFCGHSCCTNPDPHHRHFLGATVCAVCAAVNDDRPRVPEGMTPETLNIAADLLDDMRTRICAAVGAEDTGGRYSQLLRGWAREIGTGT